MQLFVLQVVHMQLEFVFCNFGINFYYYQSKSQTLRNLILYGMYIYFFQQVSTIGICIILFRMKIFQTSGQYIAI